MWPDLKVVGVELMRRDLDEGCAGGASDGWDGGVCGRGGPGSAWRVHVAQEAWRGRVGILLESRGGVLRVGSAEV